MYTCINVLANNFAWRCCAYQENMKEIFTQIPTETTKHNPEYFKEKRLTFLTDIVGEWYL